MDFKAILKKLFDFAVICVAALAGIGATIYLFYFKQPLFGACNILLTAMAAPFVYNCVNDLMK